jgi:hypothetical protein
VFRLIFTQSAFTRYRCVNPATEEVITKVVAGEHLISYQTHRIGPDNTPFTAFLLRVLTIAPIQSECRYV